MKKIYLPFLLMYLSVLTFGQTDATFADQKSRLKSGKSHFLSPTVVKNSVVEVGNQVIYNYSGKIDTFTVPSNVFKIKITAIGAAGGIDLDSNFPGGLGALVSGEFDVIPGDKLKLLVGENPLRNGGGGGSFVTDLLNNPLIIAGGGGGSGESDSPEKHGSVTETGGKGGGTGGDGGIDGNGGLANGSGYQSGAGGGFFTNGINGSSPMIGGIAFINGGNQVSVGYGDGGFGGGGTGSGYVVGGGGGGYSGGGAAGNGTGGGVGGGGASFNSGTNKIFIAENNSGHGQIIIELLADDICPGNITVDNDPGECGAVVNFTVTAPEKGSAVQTGGLPSGTEFPIGTMTNTFELTDSLGVETTCSFTVTVNDTEAPVVICPEDIVVSNDPGECGAVVTFSTLVDETLLDDVSPGSISEWEVYDYYNNPAFYYEEITSPYDGTTAIKTRAVGNTYSYCSTESLTKIYNISGNTDITKLKAYLEFTSNLTTYNFPYVQVELLDEDDNSLGFQIYYGKDIVGSWYLNNHISVNPAYYTEFPAASGDMILDLSKIGENIDFSKISIKLSNYTCIGENSIIFDRLRVVNGSLDNGTENNGPVASDNCSGVLVEASIPSGSLFPVGTTPVTLTATDTTGNTTTCSFNVTVNDTEAPVALCRNGSTGKNVLLLWDVDNENTQNLKASLENEGYNVTMPAVPEYQWDNTNPPLDGFDAVIHLNGETYSYPLPLVAQNALVDFVNVQGKAFIHSEWDAYEIDDEHTQDAMSDITILQRYSGNTTDLTYTVVPGKESHPVLKDIPNSFTISYVGHSPTNVRSYATQPAEMLMTDQYGTAAVAIREFGNGKVVGFNHAGNYAGSNSLTNALVQQLYINALKWGSNLTGEFEFVLDETDTVVITPDDIDQGSTDNCEIATKELSQTEFTYSDLGAQEVTLTITDQSGNASTCTANITITGGSEKPVVVANPLEVYLDENGIYYLTPDDLEEMATGTTDDTTPFKELKLKAYPHIFRCNQIGEIIHTRISVEDAEGNVSRAWTEVTVLDTIAPLAVCQNIEVYLNENGEVMITPDQVMNASSFDACGIDTIAVNKNTFSCADLGENTITLMITDLSGNLGTCTATVTVIDTLPPLPLEIADIVIEVEPGVCETLIEYPLELISDNCDVILEQTAGLGPEGLFQTGTTVETWLATDNGGNTTEISFSVTITSENSTPTIDAINHVSVNEDAPALTVQLTGISYGTDCIEQEVTLSAEADNLDLITSVAIEYTNGETASLLVTLAPDMNGSSVVSVTVEDSEGASVTESFTLTVTPENDSPFVVYQIADQVINASYVLKIPVSPALGKLFNDPDGDELTVSATLENGDPLPSWAHIAGDTLLLNPMIADTGCVQILVKAIDPSGAYATNSFKLCVDGYPVSSPLIDGYSFDVKMYPNPTHGRVNIEINNAGGITDVAVFSITGKELLRKNFYNNKIISFNMNDYVSGIYLVKMNIEGNQIIKKLVLDKK